MLPINAYKKQSLLVGSLLFAAVCYLLMTQPQMKQFEGQTMGTTYHVSYLCTRLFGHSADIYTKVHDALHDIDLRMSTYRQQSELMQFNQAPLNTPFQLSADIINLIKQSHTISEMSGGAYDVTVGPLVNLWGFGPKKHEKNTINSAKNTSPSDTKTNNSPQFVEWLLKNYPGEIPAQSAIKQALNNVGYQHLTVDTVKNTLTRHKAVFVDLSAIAKGYAVDQATKVLKDNGVHQFMIEVGGEVFVSGTKADGRLWRLAIRGPELGKDKPPAIVALKDKALATSGNYLNFFEVDGQRYSHSINPNSGYPENNSLAEVAVISETVAEADALATMFMVLGQEKGLNLANSKGIAAYFTYHAGNRFESLASQTFQPFLANSKAGQK